MGVQFAGNILVQSNGGPLPIANGGTGQTSAATAINALLPSQAGQSGKYLTTNGSVASWATAAGGGTPGGADTQIQYNDAGTFGGSSFLTVNKSTGAVTSTSTLTNQGLLVSKAAATNRTLDFQTSGSDRWLVQANSISESGANAGSNFEIVRVADNGTTQNIAMSISRATGVVDFASVPTVAGSPIAASPGGSTTQLQYNNAGAFAGSADLTWTNGSSLLTLNGTLAGTDGGITGTGGMTIRGGAPSSGQPGAVNISGGTPASASIGGALNVTAGSSASGVGGTLLVSGGDAPGGGGGATFRAGDATGAGAGAAATYRGGDTASNASNGGSVTIRGGNSSNATTSGNGGTVAIAGGTSTTVGVGGAITFATAVNGAASIRLTVQNNGVIATATGTSVDFGARYTELNSAVTATSTTNLDCSLGNNFTISMGAAITSLTFSNIPASGRVYSMTLYLAYTGAFGVTWPAAVKWAGATAPTLTSTNGKTDVITLVTRDAGTTWLGFVGGLNF